MKERHETTNQEQKEAGSSTLEKATRYVNDLWFPVNQKILSGIKQGLEKGRFDQDIRALVAEITTDHSLFFYCLRELLRIVGDEDSKLIPKDLSPTKMLEWGGLDRLKAILDVDIEDISPHRLRSINTFQMTRYQESMVSASASETLANKYALDPELAYSAALLRQLGVTLIAWNYPVVYQKAIGELAKGANLDLVLTQMFGFSPTMLAIKICEGWNLPSSLFKAVALDPAQTVSWSEEQEADAIAKSLIKVCKIGEALARANNPSEYPTAKNDWQFANSEIKEQLGEKGIEIIREHIRQNCLKYSEEMPQLFTPALVLDPEGRISLFIQEEMLRRNPFINQARGFLKQKLILLYDNIRPFEVSRDLLTKLAKDIIPTAGFLEGVVYTLEPSQQLLVPQLAVGTATIKIYPTLEYSPYTKSDTDEGVERAVIEAFRSGDLMTTRTADSSARAVVGLAGPLGFSNRVGVLYLEIGEMMYEDDTTQHMTHFRALLQSFNDALGLA
jgi:hypothetical protein